MKLLLLLALALPVFAQQPKQTINVTSDPTGPCSTLQSPYNLLNIAATPPRLWACIGGVWTLTSATGGGGSLTGVSLTMPSWLIVTPSGTQTISAPFVVTPATAQTSHQVIGTCGSATAFSPCAPSTADLSDSANIVLKNQANTYSGGGLQDMNAMKWKPPVTVVGSLPAATSGNKNQIYIVTDGTSATDCSVGSSTNQAWCISTGSAWASLASSASAGVNTFNTRNGDVTAQSGDYTVTQVTNAVAKNAANTYSGGGLQDFNAMKFKPPLTVVGSLPAAGAGNTNQVYMVTDGTSNSDCATGSSTYQALCASNGSAWVALGSAVTAGVTTFNTRAGAVTPTTADYTAAQVTNAVSKIAANTYSGGGLQDLSAMKTKPSATVVASLPTASSNTDVIYLVTDGATTSDCSAGSGSLLVWCGSDGSSWLAVGGGGGAGGNIATLDCGLSFSSTTVLYIFASASSTNFCSIGNNGTARKYTGQISITQSGSGHPTVRVYVSDGSDSQTAGNIIVLNSAGSGIAVSGTGGVLVNNASSFPVSCGIYIIGTWASTSAGAFDSTGTVQRPLMNSGCNIIAGAYSVVTNTTAGTTSGIDPTQTTLNGGTYLVSTNSTLSAGAGSVVCDDGSGGIQDSGCSAASNTPAVFYAGVSCDAGTPYMNGWANYTTNRAAPACLNNVNGYLGGYMQFTSAGTNVAVLTGIPVPSWWTSGTVTLRMHVYGDNGGSGNLQLQGATFCKNTSTVVSGSAQTYNSPNATNTATGATVNHVYLLSATLTMTGCSANDVLTIKVSQTVGDTWTQNTDILDSTVTFQ